MNRSIPSSWMLLAALLLAATVGAQTFAGKIVGRVVDSQQTAIPNAGVTLRNLEREFKRHTVANAQGEYTFELVPPGTYTVLMDHEGFAPTAVNVEVVVATTVRVDMTLGIQPVQQEVRVVGESGVAVQTDNAGLGRVVSTHEITELPSLGRSLYDFIAIMPGASLSNDALGVGYAVNGGRTQSVNYLLDGSENNEISMSAPAMDVPLYSIQELNIQTNHFSAEYGRTSALPRISPPRVARTIFMALFTTTSAIQRLQPTRSTTMLMAYRGPCSIGTSSAALRGARCAKGNSSTSFPPRELWLEAADLLPFLCPRRICWPSVLPGRRPFLNAFHSLPTCRRPT